MSCRYDTAAVSATLRRRAGATLGLDDSCALLADADGDVITQPGAGSLLIPFFGIGGFGYNVEVENRTSAPMPIQGDITIAPGERRSFTAGFTTLEAGLRFQRLVFFGGSGGMTAGFEAGFLASLAPGVWRAGETELHEHDSAPLGWLRPPEPRRRRLLVPLRPCW